MSLIQKLEGVKALIANGWFPDVPHEAKAMAQAIATLDELIVEVARADVVLESLEGYTVIRNWGEPKLVRCKPPELSAESGGR